MRVVCRLDLSVCLQLMLLSEVHEAQMCVTKPYGARVRDIKCVCAHGHMGRQTSGDDLFFTPEEKMNSSIARNF